MIVRDATDADLQSCTEVWASTQPDLSDDPIPYQPLSSHELNTGRLVVAEIDGVVVGFGGTITRSGVLYLVDLFVLPAEQSHGIGRQLLHALCAGHRGPLFTFASSDPRARRLYEQYGMHGIESYHYLDAPLDRLVPWDTDVELVGATRDEVLSIDLAVTRRDRAADIDFATDLGAVWYIGRRGRIRVGLAAVASPTSWSAWHPCGACVGPVMAHDPADVAPLMAAALALLGRLDHVADVVSTFAPANLAVLPILLDAGFTVISTDLLMASSPALIDRRRYLPTVETP